MHSLTSPRRRFNIIEVGDSQAKTSEASIGAKPLKALAAFLGTLGVSWSTDCSDSALISAGQLYVPTNHRAPYIVWVGGVAPLQRSLEIL